MRKRLGIYLFYDADGVVDDYVPYFLTEMKKFCSELCVVVNGDLNSTNRKKLTDVSDKVIERENVGFDSGAYKHIIEMYGYDYLKTLDELLICNYTFFGPVFPLKELFDEMDNRECDFWGIYRHPKLGVTSEQINIEEHIQSHFIAYRNSILKSPHFKEYWDTLKLPTGYIEAIVNHEIRGTKYFEERGFKSTTYLDKEKYFNLYNGNASIALATMQTIEDRCPIIKRKVFFINDNNEYEYTIHTKQVPKLINFIKSHTNYDFNLIAKNMIRTQFMNDKFNEACFNYLAKRGKWFKCFYKCFKYHVLYNILPKIQKQKDTIKKDKNMYLKH